MFKSILKHYDLPKRQARKIKKVIKHEEKRKSKLPHEAKKVVEETTK